MPVGSGTSRPLHGVRRMHLCRCGCVPSGRISNAAQSCQRCVMGELPGKRPFAIEDSTHQLVISASVNPSSGGEEVTGGLPSDVVATPAVPAPFCATAAPGEPVDLAAHSDDEA